MSESLTLADVYLEVNKHASKLSQAEIARRIGVGRSRINQMLNGVKPLSQDLLIECGIERVVSYRKVQS